MALARPGQLSSSIGPPAVPAAHSLLPHTTTECSECYANVPLNWMGRCESTGDNDIRQYGSIISETDCTCPFLLLSVFSFDQKRAEIRNTSY